MIYNGVICVGNCHSLVSNDVSYISFPIVPSGLHTDKFIFFFLERGSTIHRAFPGIVQYNPRKGKKYTLTPQIMFEPAFPSFV